MLIFIFASNALLFIYFLEENSIHFTQFLFFWLLDCFCISLDQAEPFYCLKLQYAITRDFMAVDLIFIMEIVCLFWAISSLKPILFLLYFHLFIAITYLFEQYATIYLWEPQTSKHFHQFPFLTILNHSNNLVVVIFSKVSAASCSLYQSFTVSLWCYREKLPQKIKKYRENTFL